MSALLHPERFPEPIYYGKGSEDLSHREIAALLAEATGRPIEYQHVTQEEWREDLLALARASDEEVINPAMAQHIAAVGHNRPNRS